MRAAASSFDSLRDNAILSAISDAPNSSWMRGNGRTGGST
jgi:hypothetical protein